MKPLEKIFTAGILAAVASYFSVVAIPVIMLVCVMIIDYATGMTSAFISRTVSSRAGIVGIVKKVCYLAAVAVGICVDYIIISALSQIGIAFDFTYFFGLLVTVWLILNELISILENLSEIGVPLPGFLGSIIQCLQKTVDKKGEENKNNE